MPFNGSGTFNRVHNWVADFVAGLFIDSSRMDAEHDGFASGLSNCVTKDGQTTITGDLPMSNFKHTTVANGTARNHYAALGQVQDGAVFWGGSAAGTADALTISPTPSVAAYVDGLTLRLRVATNNTGAVTIDVSGLGTRPIVKGAGSSLIAGDLIAGTLIEIVYRSTQFHITGMYPNVTVVGRLVLEAATEAAARTAIGQMQTANIGDAQITTAKVLDEAITVAKIADGTATYRIGFDAAGEADELEPEVSIITSAAHSGVSLDITGFEAGYDYEVLIDSLVNNGAADDELHVRLKDDQVISVFVTDLSSRILGATGSGPSEEGDNSLTAVRASTFNIRTTGGDEYDFEIFLKRPADEITTSIRIDGNRLATASPRCLNSYGRVISGTSEGHSEMRLQIGSAGTQTFDCNYIVKKLRRSVIS